MSVSLCMSVCLYVCELPALISTTVLARLNLDHQYLELLAAGGGGFNDLMGEQIADLTSTRISDNLRRFSLQKLFN